MDPNLVPGCLPVYTKKWNVLFQLWMLSLSFTDHLSLSVMWQFSRLSHWKKRWMSDASGNQTSSDWVTGSQWTKQYTWIRTTFTGVQVKVSQSVSLCLSESVRQVESAFYCQKKVPVMGDEGWRGNSGQGQSGERILSPRASGIAFDWCSGPPPVYLWQTQTLPQMMADPPVGWRHDEWTLTIVLATTQRLWASLSVTQATF